MNAPATVIPPGYPPANVIIKPTIGRRVWYWPNAHDRAVMGALDAEQPMDAGIAYVWTDRMVNLTVADHLGRPHQRTSVRLVQPDEERPNDSHATWMPFQAGQVRAQAAA